MPTTATPSPALLVEVAAAWQSERLVYRSVVTDGAGVAFIQSVNSDPGNVALSGDGLLRPHATAAAHDLAGALGGKAYSR